MGAVGSAIKHAATDVFDVAKDVGEGIYHEVKKVGGDIASAVKNPQNLIQVVTHPEDALHGMIQDAMGVTTKALKTVLCKVGLGSVASVLDQGEHFIVHASDKIYDLAKSKVSGVVKKLMSGNISGASKLIESIARKTGMDLKTVFPVITKAVEEDPELADAAKFVEANPEVLAASGKAIKRGRSSKQPNEVMVTHDFDNIQLRMFGLLYLICRLWTINIPGQKAAKTAKNYPVSVYMSESDTSNKRIDGGVKVGKMGKNNMWALFTIPLAHASVMIDTLRNIWSHETGAVPTQIISFGVWRKPTLFAHYSFVAGERMSQEWCIYVEKDSKGAMYVREQNTPFTDNPIDCSLQAFISTAHEYMHNTKQSGFSAREISHLMFCLYYIVTYEGIDAKEQQTESYQEPQLSRELAVMRRHLEETPRSEVESDPFKATKVFAENAIVSLAYLEKDTKEFVKPNMPIV